MMILKTSAALAALAAACASLPAHAVTWTVDTGTPSGAGNALLLSTNDFVAGQVDLAGSTRIDAVQAYVDGGAAGESFTLALYGASAGHPAGEALYTATAMAGNGAGWYGASGLGWTLAPGAASYWVAVEMSATDSLGDGIGAGGTLPVGVAQPLTATAFYDGSGFSYRASADTLQFGLRVAAVPEPGPAAMLALGLAVMAALARRRAR